VAGYKFDYEKKVAGGDIIRVKPYYFRASRLYWALRTIKSHRGKLLDVGCGAGDFLEAFSFYRKDLSLTGIDLSKKSVGLAKKRNIRAKFLVADAHKLPFKDHSFDIVTCFDMIEHVKNPELVLSEIGRVLKPPGVFHSFIPTEKNIFSFEGFLIKLGWKGKEIYAGHPQHFSFEQIKKMLGKNGFKIINIAWGDHFIHQFAETVYFTLLSKRRKIYNRTVEGYLHLAEPSIINLALKLITRSVAAVSYFENRLLWWFPGLGVNITCKK